MGFEPRKPSPEELEEMKKLVEEAMMDGCIGMSTGLVYPPGFYADTEEIIELCKVVAKYDGIYASHVRGDRETQIESAQEFIEIAEKAGISAQLSHIEAKFPKNDPSFQKWKLAMLEEARSRGVDVTADTHEVQWIGVKDIRALLPFPWRTKTAEELYEILKKDGNMREQIKKDMQLDPRDPRARGGPFGLTQQRAWHRVKVYKSNVNKELNGKTIEEIAKIRNKQSEDVLLDLFVEENGKGPSLLLNYIESDMSTTAKHPLVVVPITDLTASNPEDVEGEMFENSPEWLGAFPNAIRKYALEYRYVTLEECIRKMTSLPYRIMKIWDRGIIRPGFWADIVIFDKERIRCKSDLDRPKEYPEGIHYVIVNGEIVVENGEFTGKYPGKILSHQYF
jgi:N-acyl-D-amino-acid deacylase